MAGTSRIRRGCAAAEAVLRSMVAAAAIHEEAEQHGLEFSQVAFLENDSAEAWALAEALVDTMLPTAMNMEVCGKCCEPCWKEARERMSRQPEYLLRELNRHLPIGDAVTMPRADGPSAAAAAGGSAKRAAAPKRGLLDTHNSQAGAVRYAALSSRTSIKSGRVATCAGQVSFQWKNPDFLLRNPDFLIWHPDFLVKNVDFTIKMQLRERGKAPARRAFRR